jgi:hypothetical protein
MNIRKVKLSLKSHKNVIFDKSKQHFPFASQMFLNSYQKWRKCLFYFNQALLHYICIRLGAMFPEPLNANNQKQFLNLHPTKYLKKTFLQTIK